MPDPRPTSLPPALAEEFRAAALELDPLPDAQLDALADVLAQIDVRTAAEWDA